MKLNLLLLLIFITSTYIFPQSEMNKFIDAEKKAYSKLILPENAKYPGDTTIDVTYYKLDLKIHETDSTISGNTTIGFKINNQPLNSFFLDLSNPLTVDSVLLQNQKLSFNHTNNKVFITLNRIYNTNERISVVVFYHGRPGSTGFGSFVFSTHSGTPFVWSLSEPYGAPDWFPCKDTPGDKADSSDVWVTCNSALTAASNGVLLAVVNNGDGTSTYKWKNHYPIAQYLISIAVTNYTEYKEYFRYSPTDSMPVVHYILPELLTNSVKADFDKTLLMLQIFSNRYGLYPFIKEKYGHAQFGWGGGMEHQTLTSLTFNQQSEDIVSHELSHQWFGDKITCRNWQNIWLNEGFATYSQGVYDEGAYGKKMYDSFISHEMQIAKAAQGSIYVQDITNVNSIFDTPRSYAKGGVVLHMLRGIVGDSTFFRIMRTYAADPALAYGTAVTEDFQRDAEAVYGSSLDYFFKEWIYGENFPNYNVSWSSSNTGGNLYTVNVKLNQAVNNNPAFFTMPVQLNIKSSSGDTLITVFNNQQSQEFNIVVKGQPTGLVFDHGNWILKDTTFITSVKQPGVINSFELSQNYPNPFNPATTIKYTIPAQSPFIKGGSPAQRGGGFVTLKIYDILGKEVATLVNTQQLPGEYEVRFSPANYGLSSGIYFYRLKAGGFVQSKKMAYIK